MLQKLIIRNYAIIDHLVVEPDSGLNIVTGETGAGKSIILGALSLILGARADTSVLIRKSEKCVVEAFFDVQGNKMFLEALREAELDEDTQCIIRREISSAGKSRAFVNDTPVTLAVLNQLTSLLVDLHQQFDQLDIRNEQFQLDVLDAVAQNTTLLTKYRQQYRAYRDAGERLSGYTGRQAQLRQEVDYKQYLLTELLDADFREGEVEEADQQLRTMTHAERIREVLQAGRYALDEGETSLLGELKRISQQLQGITGLMPDIQPLADRILSARTELQDVADELQRYQDKVLLDPEQMGRLRERIDLGYKLLKKHNVADTVGLLAIQAQLEADLQETTSLDEQIRQCREEYERLEQQLRETGAAMSSRRSEAASGFAEDVSRLLASVDMPGARFAVSVQPVSDPGPSGMDEVQFLLDANRSGQLLPVYKAASGGEMSRIMLAIKSLTAKAMDMPVLIFDEVDTGISGEAARQVGALLRELAAYHQVISITHQPQVAAKATRHFYVYKEADGTQQVHTRLRVLEPDERVTAIARMIGGDQPGEAALQHARELVGALS